MGGGGARKSFFVVVVEFLRKSVRSHVKLDDVSEEGPEPEADDYGESLPLAEHLVGVAEEQRHLQGRGGGGGGQVPRDVPIGAKLELTAEKGW